MNTLIKFFKTTLMLILLLLGFNNVATAAATLSPTTQTVTGTVNIPLVSTATPVATGFTGTVSYTISPALSAGLALSSSTGVISGTPTVAKVATKYTITAKGTTGSASTIVNLTISNPTALSPATQTITGFVGSSITATRSITASNFSGAVTYTVSPVLPIGLVLNATTGVITGIPTTPQSGTSYIITGQGATSGTATTVVTITVSTPSITPASQTVSGIIGKAITSTSSMVATGLSGTVTYAITPTLPTGLAFSTSKGVISSTPSVASTLNTYTITATGATGGNATALVTLSVVPPPPAISPATQTLSGVMNTAVKATRAFTATYFTGAVSYSISPALSAGLTLNTTTGVINGTPTIDQVATVYTITATDSTLATATSTITITIALPPPSITPSTQSVIGPVGSSITPTTALVAKYFGGTVSYGISPALPAGIVMDTTTGIISGTPTTTQAATIYTITATGSTSGTATARVTITFPPAAVTPATQTITGKINTAIRATRAYTANYFSGTVSYAISPALTSGLMFDTTTGVISGTPTAIQLATTYSITATGTISGVATASVALTISPDVTPSNQKIKWPINAPINPTIALTPIGFTGAVSYSISPALPNGLVLDTITGIISGTSTVAQLSTNYVITVTDGVSGSATASINIIITNPPNCLPPSLSAVAEGRRAYLRLNCYSCHGDTGLGGMGPNIQGESGGVNDAVPNGAEGGMPPFDNYLCANDLTYLEAYLKVMGRNGAPSFKHWWEPTPTQ